MFGVAVSNSENNVLAAGRADCVSDAWLPVDAAGMGFANCRVQAYRAPCDEKDVALVGDQSSSRLGVQRGGFGIT